MEGVFLHGKNQIKQGLSGTKIRGTQLFKSKAQRAIWSKAQKEGHLLKEPKMVLWVMGARILG